MHTVGSDILVFKTRLLSRTLKERNFRLKPGFLVSETHPQVLTSPDWKVYLPHFPLPSAELLMLSVVCHYPYAGFATFLW